MRNDSFDSEAMSGESGDDEVETKNQTDREKGKNVSDEDEKEPQIQNLDLIRSISSALTTILEENKKLDNYKEIVKKQGKMIYSANSIPNISINDYLIRIQTYSNIEKSTLILTLIQIDHICRKADIILTYYNIHRLLFAAVLISIKYNEDSYYDNKFYSEIAGVKLKELKMMEYTFLELNDFNVFVNDEEYEQYRLNLEKFNDLPDDDK
jgi:hypothetical protein